MVKRLSSLAEVLASIPEREDPFPRLAFLSTDALLLRRLEIAEMLKHLEEERKVAQGFADAK